MQLEPGKRQPEAPPIVMWELTRACRLQCMHCTAGAQARRNPLELSTYESYKTIDQIVALGPSELVITGGDPLERVDVFQLIDYARRRGIRPAVTLTPSTLLTGSVFGKLRTNGVDRVIFSIDGANPERHDAVRGIRGHFTTTLQAIRWARTSGIPVEINTLVSRPVARELATIADLVAELGAIRWNLYFPVPVKAARELEMLTADEVEEVFGRVFELSARVPYQIRTFEAPHYARYLLQRAIASRQETIEKFFDNGVALELPHDSLFSGTIASNVVFVSHTGEVSVSPFSPVVAGNVRYQPLSWVYQYSDLFTTVRDDSNLKGKCGRCEYRTICQGSRARAFAISGDIFAADPVCAYQPGTYSPAAALSRGREADTGGAT